MPDTRAPTDGRATLPAVRAGLVSWLLAALVVSGCASPASALTLTPQQVGPHTWYFEGEAGMANAKNRGFMSNAGFVITPGGVVVFDALATPALAEAMLTAIAEKTDAPVRHVIVSHYHADHVYGLQVFADVGATIWAHEDAADYIGSESAIERLAERRQSLAPWVDAQTRVLPADRWLTLPVGQTHALEVGGIQLEILSAGDAHSPGNLMLNVPADQVLFAGDLFFTRRIPFVVDGNTQLWLQALDNIEARSARVVVPGHGPASTTVAQDLDATRRYLTYLRAALSEAVDNMTGFEAAYRQIDWSSFADMPLFEAAHRRNAYSIYLELEAESLR